MTFNFDPFFLDQIILTSFLLETNLLHMKAVRLEVTNLIPKSDDETSDS